MNYHYVNALNTALRLYPSGTRLYYAHLFGRHPYANPIYSRWLREQILAGRELRFKLAGSLCRDGFIIV